MSNVSIAPFVRRHSRCRLERRHPGGAFTLLELLIVIGIIALLISLLLPALARTRESARQAGCLAHLRSLAQALQAYVNDNDGNFPGPAGTMPGYNWTPATTDWILWQPGTGPTTISNIANAGIGSYLHLNYGDPSSLAVLRCPSDDTNARPAGGNTPYPFSYVMNGWMASQPALGPGMARALRQVKDPSQKIMFYEEDSQTLNDGCGNLMPPPSDGQVDLLAVRHDWAVHSQADGPSDKPGSGGGSAGSGPNVPYADAKGNVVFYDGHAEFFPRSEAHRKAHYLADATALPYGNDPSLP